MREIILDTETTGLDPSTGDRVVEIGCVEIINGIPTGKTFHRYLNPERDMPAAAEAVHGLSAAFLADKPKFGEVVGEFLDFIAADPLIAHNASFDMNFIDFELKTHGFPGIAASRVIDSLVLARKAFPGQPCSLDALCKRFSVDTSSRQFHGALLDARLLADVYLELTGGRQREIAISFAAKGKTSRVEVKREPREPRPHEATEEELAAHEEAMKKLSGTLWN
jgi:DNA polymerase-3 subunit epsilon